MPKPFAERVKARAHDLPILAWVAHRGFAATQQVVYRFFVLPGRGPSYGYQVVARLVREGLLRRDLLHAGQGRASPHVLSLTPLGHHVLGTGNISPDLGRFPEAARDGALQMTQALLIREHQGWLAVPEDERFEMLRDFAVSCYRGRLINSSEAQDRRQLEKAGAEPVGLEVIAHENAAPRIVIGAHDGYNHRAALARLPRFSLFPELHFELVCCCPDTRDALERDVRAWAKRAGISNVETHHVPPFQNVVHPAIARRRLIA